MDMNQLIEMATHIRGNFGLSDTQRAALSGIPGLIATMRAAEFEDSEIAVIIGGYIDGEVYNYSLEHDEPSDKPAGNILYFKDPGGAGGGRNPFDAFDQD